MLFYGFAVSSSASLCHAGIRLAGATNDVHIMDVRTGRWERWAPQGEPPSPRAAHAAAAVGSMVVVQGGIGPAGLASEDLHVLDFTDQARPRWHRVSVAGPGPSARYAHTLALVANRFLVASGGNDGRTTLQDAWALDTSEKPYAWRRVGGGGEDDPPARMYAAAAARSDGLLLLCGGRDSDGTPLGDAYGLARHRDGRWEWAAAPGTVPEARYQLGAVFVNARLHVLGGAVGGGRVVDGEASSVVLDTALGQWVGIEEEGNDEEEADGAEQKGSLTRKGSSESDSPRQHQRRNAAEFELVRRCRHAMASVGSYIFVHGGLRGSTLLEDVLLADDSAGSELTVCDPRAPAWQQWINSVHGVDAAVVLAKAAAEEAAAAAAMGVRRVAPSHDLEADEAAASAAAAATAEHPRVAAEGPSSGSPPSTGSSLSLAVRRRGEFPPSRDMPTPDVRLYHRAVVVAQDDHGELRGLVRQLSIEHLEAEGRRVSLGNQHDGSGSAGRNGTPLFERAFSMRPQGVHKLVLQKLLLPRRWRPSEGREFILDADRICELCDAAEAIFREEPSLLRLRAPVKIFGDLHGQYGDLMRLFEEYGTPSTSGDITYIDYLFLGDYVDRGAYSLETLCLLLALKINHPESVHLIRGNHEAADINALFGFRMECLERLGDAEGLQAWSRFNQLFNWLPLAAVIEDRVLCMHGGIGRSIHSMEQIEELQRPLTMEEGGVVLMDLLWSGRLMVFLFAGEKAMSK